MRQIRCDRLKQMLRDSESETERVGQTMKLRDTVKVRQKIQTMTD